MTIVQGIPASISNLLQDRTLERVFHDGLYPALLYRGEAVPELWQSNLGERQVFTRTGLIRPKTRPLTPGSDPVPANYSVEQWEAEAAQYGDTIDTHMPTNYTTLASTFLRNTQQLGLGAGQSLNRLIRNRLFTAYLAGSTVTRAVVAAANTTIPVVSLNGFTTTLSNGRLVPVSPANPVAVTFTGTEPANAVVGATPDDPANPLGSGTLTLQSVLTVGLAQREGVLAGSRSRQLQVGGGATIDALTSANILTLNTIITAVSRLRAQNVPPHADGNYHVHLTPAGEAQLFQDNHWQRLHQSLPDSAAYRDLAIGKAVGCIFYRNNESPSQDTVDPDEIAPSPGGAGGGLYSPEIGGEVRNEGGVGIARALITAGGVVYEKYLDESKFISEAGVNGKIGQFSIINGGVAVMTDRIRYILRAPQDRLQQVVTQTWSWSGDFPVPTDALTGNPAAYKRAISITHAAG